MDPQQKAEKKDEMQDTPSPEDVLRNIRARTNHLQEILVANVSNYSELVKHVNVVEKAIQDSKDATK